MENISEKFDFQITLESGELEKSSKWQKQCQLLYDSVRKNLPNGSIDPVTRKGKDGERSGVILSYDTFALAGVTLNSFYILLRLINVWERNRKKANVKLRTKNGSEFVLSNLSVEEAREIYEKLQNEDY
ncbi:hypothetical protein [Methanosarcina sp. UBA5]|uniref:hypothetical protein n=1 Tax=Methanosarcina sp. UBA5 TaxID=1915593 RepID=UPI0025E4BEF4|nr:hypothetical protein [Methanosarcina sp. UBA5]